MSEWKTYRADEFCKTVTDGTHDSPKPQTCGRYLITSKHLKSSGIDFSSANKISEEDYQKIIKRSNVEQYDILFSMIGTVGNIHRVTIPNVDFAVKNMGIFKMGGDAAKSLWMYYWLQSPEAKKYINSRITGSTQGYLTLKNLRDFPVCVPPLAEQKRIADILSAIDDKIELNRRINTNLEQQAQALYKSWFVDFEPFGGKMPEDWKKGTLGDIIETIESGSRPKGGSETNGVPSIGAEKIERFGHYEYSGEKFINRDYFHKMKRGHVKNGDVLLYKDGAYTGKTSMVLDGFPYRECAVNEHVFILRTVASKYQFFLYCLMSYPDIRKMVYTLASAKAAQPGLNQTELLGVNIVVPSYNMIKKFNHFITPHMHQIAINALESSRLAQLRDTLLPKLMTGEITV